jgi:response regulator RpfG family c-di-GMP phosphodiesterase
MKHILIYTLKADSSLIVQKLSEEYEIIVCHSFAEAMESIGQKVPHLIISDYLALRHDKSQFHHALHNDFILIDIPVIAIGCFETDNMEMLSIRQKLYTFNIKRYLYIHSEDIDLQKTVNRELDKWNPHLGSYTHRFVKSFLLFADSKKYEQRMRIHLTYIMSHYSLSNVAVSDIKFASAILSTTFTTQNYESVLAFYTKYAFRAAYFKTSEKYSCPF